MRKFTLEYMSEVMYNFVQFYFWEMGVFIVTDRTASGMNMCPRFKEDVMRSRTMWWFHDAEGVWRCVVCGLMLPSVGFLDRGEHKGCFETE